MGGNCCRELLVIITHDCGLPYPLDVKTLNYCLCSCRRVLRSICGSPVHNKCTTACFHRVIFAHSLNSLLLEKEKEASSTHPRNEKTHINALLSEMRGQSKMCLSQLWRVLVVLAHLPLEWSSDCKWLISGTGLFPLSYCIEIFWYVADICATATCTAAQTSKAMPGVSVSARSMYRRIFLSTFEAK